MLEGLIHQLLIDHVCVCVRACVRAVGQAGKPAGGRACVRAWVGGCLCAWVGGWVCFCGYPFCLVLNQQHLFFGEEASSTELKVAVPAMSLQSSASPEVVWRLGGFPSTLYQMYNKPIQATNSGLQVQRIPSRAAASGQFQPFNLAA